MAYFNHAFVKCFNPAGAKAGDTTKTSALTAGQIAFVDGSTWKAVTPSASLPTAGNLGYIVQGSYHTQDSIGNNPGHGGYTESVKSKGINPRYVSRLYSTDVIEASQSTSVITVASTCAPCDDPLYLRLDVKGSPALRFLNHNAYAVADSDGVCCSEPGQTYVDPALALAQAGARLMADPIVSPFVRERYFSSVAAGIVVTNTKTTGGLGGISAVAVGTTAGTNYTVGDLLTIASPGSGAVVKVTTVNGTGGVTAIELVHGGHGYTGATGAATSHLVVANSAAAGFIVNTTVDDNTGSFSLAEITDGTYTPSTDPVADGVSASFHIEGAYAETKFGACSFDTRDFYGKEPVQLNLAILDETGDPCNDCGVTVNTPGVMASTVGETVLRDILMTENYMQSPYNQGNPDSARIREIEGSDDIVGSVDRTALYKVYVIQHSVPRFNNPTSTFDNDQYCYKIYVKSTDATLIGEMDTLMTNIATWCNGMGGNVAFVNGIETP